MEAKPEGQQNGFIGPNSLGSVLMLGVVTSTCVAFIIWFMRREMDAPPYRIHVE